MLFFSSNSACYRVGGAWEFWKIYINKNWFKFSWIHAFTFVYNWDFFQKTFSWSFMKSWWAHVNISFIFWTVHDLLYMDKFFRFSTYRNDIEFEQLGYQINMFSFSTENAISSFRFLIWLFFLLWILNLEDKSQEWRSFLWPESREAENLICSELF